MTLRETSRVPTKGADFLSPRAVSRYTAMNPKLKKIWSIVSTVIVILVVLLVIALVGVRLVGITPLMVISGSMEPTIPTGSILYILPVDDPNELEVDTTITFRLAGASVEAPDKVGKGGGVEYATHRIIEVHKDPNDPSKVYYRTQGDANDTADGLLPADRVVGKYLFHLPVLGFLAMYIQNPPGVYVTVAVGAVLILLMFLPDLIAWVKADEKSTAKATAAAEGGEDAAETPTEGE